MIFQFLLFVFLYKLNLHNFQLLFSLVSFFLLLLLCFKVKVFHLHVCSSCWNIVYLFLFLIQVIFQCYSDRVEPHRVGIKRIPSASTASERPLTIDWILEFPVKLSVSQSIFSLIKIIIRQMHWSCHCKESKRNLLDFLFLLISSSWMP